jgi:tRNA G10  N-methylase Trm11
MNQQSLCILGRQPGLSFAELESIYGQNLLRPIGHNALIIDRAPEEIVFTRLGGVMKLCAVQATFSNAGWRSISSYLKEFFQSVATNDDANKVTVGISVYGIDVSPKQILATGLELKKLFRAQSRSFRLVPNQKNDLNSAQVIHNRLTQGQNMELVFVRDGADIVCGRTSQIQDIDAYSNRDFNRPFRDSRIGMLPPKLAQIIINLAAGTISSPATVLDPFCGSGVILQEAALMGYAIYGTDIDDRMISYTQKNIEWLLDRHPLENLRQLRLEVADATTHAWQKPFNIIASELYLGRPYNHLPERSELETNRTNCNTIIEKFLQNLYGQLEPSQRICLALPVWQIKAGVFIHLPLLDHLEQLGYNRVSFKHARTDDLVYARSDQIVCRELLIATRN